ncbi:MAG TPA: NAD(P)-dependent oxidoreductase [Chloroflexota bacterium]|nr:NAD(P)-dependent oxidoreductase [Chloroflexota bacterium]
MQQACHGVRIGRRIVRQVSSATVESVLVLGGSGLVGTRFRELCQDRVKLLVPSHTQLDVLNTGELEAYLDEQAPEAVINLAAWADVDGAEAQRGDTSGTVYQLNAAYPGHLAQICAGRKTYLLHVSTDYVFDGENDARPYRENDVPNPLGWYAQTKLDGERTIQGSAAKACIARIEMPFTAQPLRKTDFARICLSKLQRGESIAGVADQRITPVFLDDAAAALLRLIELQVTGIVHVAAASWTTPYEFARGIAVRLELNANLIQQASFADFSQSRAAKRPQHSWLDVSKAQRLVGQRMLRNIDEQLDAWAAQVREAAAAPETVS